MESSDDGSTAVKRLSLNLPEDLHTRFKTACAATDRRMMTELLELVTRRTEELEDEAGLGSWGRQLARRQSGRVTADSKTDR